MDQIDFCDHRRRYILAGWYRPSALIGREKVRSKTHPLKDGDFEVSEGDNFWLILLSQLMEIEAG